MKRTATITSKRQLTIPIELFKRAGFSEGQKVIIRQDKNALFIQPASDLVEELAGSVNLPKRFQGKTPQEMVRQAKHEHFSSKGKQN